MHWQYLRYVARHKWFVLRAGLRLGVPLWQLLVHDWTKFLPCEWLPYARFFYGGPRRSWSEMTAYEKHHHWDWAWRTSKEGVQEAFDAAWNHHQKASPHHWQHWVLLKDDGSQVEVEMPDRYLREMVADWIGAGLAMGKGWKDAPGWYERNRDRIRLHRVTRIEVEDLLRR